MGRNHSILIPCIALSALLASNLSAANQVGASVPVHIQISSNIPIRIESVQATPSVSGSSGIQYKIFNAGSARLIAVEITWDLNFGAGGPERTVQRADYFFSPADLAPGASKGFGIGEITDRASDGTTAPLKSATATITYAEFADGTQLGSDIQSVSAWLTSNRDAEMAEYRQALQDYRAGGVAGLNKALAWDQMPPTSGGREVWLRLHQIQKQKGVSGVVEELTRVSQLKLPNN